MENWISIPGFAGHYEVSDLGQVRSLKGGRIRILKQAVDKAGYRIVCLTVNAKGTTRPVHKLVWSSFRGETKLSIDHIIEGDKSNNSLSNLQELTHRENITKYYRSFKKKATGSHFDKRRGTWGAEISINGKRKHLGTFKTEELAGQAYKNELQKLKQKSNVN